MRAAALPVGIGELREHWRELPPVLSVDDVLAAGWLDLGRSPCYRAIARGDLPAVAIGRRRLLLTAPLLRLIGIDTDRPAITHDEESP